MKKVSRIVYFLFGLTLMLSSCEKAPFVTMTGPRSYNFTREGGTQTFAFSCNRDWSVSSSESWIRISPSSGKAADGDITVTITCSPNTTYDSRTATITVKVEELMETISVSQDTGLGLIISPTTFDLTNDAQVIEVEVQQNVNYTIEIDEACKDWIKKGGTKALSTDKVTFTIAANPSYDNREGKITFKQVDGSLAGTVKIKQAYGEGLLVDKTQYEISNEAQTLNVDVNANVDFEVTSEVDWIQYIETKALTSSSVALSIQANTSSSYRNGKVVIKQKTGDLSQTLSIKQDPFPAVKTLDASNVKFSEAVLAVSVTVEGGIANSNEVWFYFSKTEETPEGLKSNGTKVKGSFDSNSGQYQYSEGEFDNSSTYFFVASFVFKEKEYFGDVKSFKTLTPSVTVSTKDATSVKYQVATLDGCAQIDADYALVDLFFLYSKDVKTLDGLKQSGTKVYYTEFYADGWVDDYYWNGGWRSVISGLISHTQYYYVAGLTINGDTYYGEVKSFTTKTIPDGAVDLGLSVCWATCNLGATTPEGYGDYYAWGEIETKTHYYWDSYKWCNQDATSLRMTKYNTDPSKGTVDNLTVLSSEDDAASSFLGNGWRMPTYFEIKELVDNCSIEWETRNDILGYIVTSNINGKSIFLPAAGCRYVDGYERVGQEVCFWASTLWPYAPEDGDIFERYANRSGAKVRCCGLPIRPVIE